MSDIMSENNEDKMIGGAVPFGAALPFGAAVPFKHDYFHMSINTFGALELYNKKKFADDSNKATGDIPRIDGIKSITPLLRITNKKEEIPDVTDEMKKLFQQYLVFFNFVIALLIHDKRFTGNDDLITFLQTNVYSRTSRNIPPYTSLLTIIGKTSVVKPKVGFKTEVVKEGWKKSGIEKQTMGTWSYSADVSGGNAIESGYTLIMDMLLAKEKLQSENLDIDIVIDIIEVCKLLAFCEAGRIDASKPELRNMLIDKLTKIGDGSETDVAELYSDFLTITYAKVIETAEHGTVDGSVGQEDTEEEEEEEEGEDTETPTVGGQKSKTLKRRQQMNNKSRRNTENLNKKTK